MDLGDLDFHEHLYHPCFRGNQLNLSALEVPWSQGDLAFRERLYHPCFQGNQLNLRVLEVLWGQWDLAFHEHQYHPCFQGNQLNLRVLEIPWGQGDHLHLCYHWDLVVPVFHGFLHHLSFLVGLWVLQVHDYRVIPQHLLVPRVQSFRECLEFLVHRNTHHDHRNHMMRSVEGRSKKCNMHYSPAGNNLFCFKYPLP